MNSMNMSDTIHIKVDDNYLRDKTKVLPQDNIDYFNGVLGEAGLTHKAEEIKVLYNPFSRGVCTISFHFPHAGQSGVCDKIYEVWYHPLSSAIKFEFLVIDLDSNGTPCHLRFTNPFNNEEAKIVKSVILDFKDKYMSAIEDSIKA